MLLWLMKIPTLINTNDANRTIPTKLVAQFVSKQMALSGGQVFYYCKWRHLVAKFGTYASGTIWWSNLEPIQVAPSGGQIWNLYKWHHLVVKFGTNASPGGQIWNQQGR